MLSPSWVQASVAKGEFVEESKHALKDKPGEKKFGFNLQKVVVLS